MLCMYVRQGVETVTLNFASTSFIQKWQSYQIHIWAVSKFKDYYLCNEKMKMADQGWVSLFSYFYNIKYCLFLYLLTNTKYYRIHQTNLGLCATLTLTPWVNYKRLQSHSWISIFYSNIFLAWSRFALSVMTHFVCLSSYFTSIFTSSLFY